MSVLGTSPRSIGWPPWRRRTARLQLSALYGSLFLISGAALIAVTYVLFQRATAYTNPQLPRVPQAPAIETLQLPPPLGKALPGASRYLYKLTKSQDQLTQNQHRLLILSTGQAGQGPPGLSPTFPSQLSADQQQLTKDQQQLSTAVNQLSKAVHQISQDGAAQAAQRAADSHRLLVDSAIALGLVAVLALLAGWLVSGRMLRPIRTITRAAQRISSTSLHERLALEGPKDELKELGDTLDDLFGRLEAAFEAQRHFVANASHELRTPLTAERSLLQVALDDPSTTTETWRSTALELLASNDEQKGLIEALLALASSESGLDHPQGIDLAEICQAVLCRVGSDTERLAVRIETDIRPAPLDGDPRLVERLVTNLVDNAVRHNVPGGRVEISTGAMDAGAVVSVTNTGPVVPSTELDRLFRPFERLQGGRSHHADGYGLGLSIVQAIAATHHATITASPGDEGGLTVTVAFAQTTSPSTVPERSPRTGRLAASLP